MLNTINKTMKALSFSIAFVILSLVICPVSLAWGPSRTTYSVESPAEVVTFNSITNNPNIGDERNFVGIRERGTDNLWSSDIEAQPDKEYVIRMYVHNNAAENLQLMAEDVTAKFNLPTTTGTEWVVNGFLSSSNSSPEEIWDAARMYSDREFNVAYVPGTARFSNNHFGSDGIEIPESVLTSEGALLGYDELDGRIPGCIQYAGYLTIIVKTQFMQEAPDIQDTSAIKILINKNELTFDRMPVIQSGRTLASFREIFESLGADTTWDESTQTITAVRGDVTITWSMGSNSYDLNGANMQFDVPAQIISGTPFVPVRAVAESFGATVGWDADARTVLIDEEVSMSTD